MTTVLGGPSNRSTRQDPIPNIRSAGHEIAGVKMESADYSIRQDVHMHAPGTPEHIKKYRKSQVNQPGQIQRHYGVADDAFKFPASFSYGKGSYGSEPVSEVIAAQNLAGLQDKFNDIKESQYASHIKEPLGKGLSRGYNWPERTQ
jgi:hypothetical protein